jgi:polar amino acid transport system substrate-binding protein
MSKDELAGRVPKRNPAARLAASLIIIIIGVAILAVSCTDSQVYIGSGHPEWPPIMYRDGDLITGAGAELVKKIAADLGFQIDIKYTGNWEEVQAKVKNGEVDLLVAAYKTSEREKYMDYSVAYTVDPMVLYVKPGMDFHYSFWSDLIGKKGVLTVGDSYGQMFDSYIQEKLTTVRVNTIAEAFDMVKSGQADYFIYALYSGEKFLVENRPAGEIEIIPKCVASEDFFITISKKSLLIKYLPAINDRLEKYKIDGTIDSLIARYRAGYLKNK